MEISKNTNIFFINLNNLFLNLKEIKIKFSLLDNFILKVTPNKTTITNQYNKANNDLKKNYNSDKSNINDYIDNILNTKTFDIKKIIDILTKIKNINTKYFLNIPKNDYTNNIKIQVDKLFQNISLEINIIVDFLEEDNLIYIEILKKILEKNKVNDVITEQLRTTLNKINEHNKLSLLSINIMLINIVELSILKYIKIKLDNNKKLPSDILDIIKYNFIKASFSEQINNNLQEKIKNEEILKIDINIHLINCPPDNNFLYKTLNNPILANYLNNKELNDNNINHGLSYFGKKLITDKTFINYENIDTNNKYCLFSSFNSLSSIESLNYFLNKTKIKSDDYNYIIPFINNNNPIKDYSIKDPTLMNQNISYSLLDEFTKYDNIKKRVIPIIILNKILKNYSIETDENMINNLFNKMKDMNKVKNNEIKKINLTNMNKNTYDNKLKNINNNKSILSKKYNLYLFASREEISYFYNNKYTNIINSLSYFNNLSCNMNIEIKHTNSESNISIYYSDKINSKNIFYDTLNKTIINNNLLSDSLFINNIFNELSDLVKKYNHSSEEDDYILILEFLNLHETSLQHSKINDIINCIYNKGSMNNMLVKLPITIDKLSTPISKTIIPLSDNTNSAYNNSLLFNESNIYNLKKYDELLPIIDNTEISKIEAWRTTDKIDTLRINYTNIGTWIDLNLIINKINHSIKIPNNIDIKITINKISTIKKYTYDKILNFNDFCYLLLYKNTEENKAICLKIYFNEDETELKSIFNNFQYNNNIIYRKFILNFIKNTDGNIIFKKDSIYYGFTILPVFEGNILSILSNLNYNQKEYIYNNILNELFVLISNNKSYFDLNLDKVLYWKKNSLYDILFDLSEIVKLESKNFFTYSVSDIYITKLAKNNLTNISFTYFIILVLWHQIYSVNANNSKLDFKYNSSTMIVQYFNDGFSYSVHDYLANPVIDDSTKLTDEKQKIRINNQREFIRKYLNIEINNIVELNTLIKIIKEMLNNKSLSKDDYLIK